jgi:hypothetical protein
MIENGGLMTVTEMINELCNLSDHDLERLESAISFELGERMDNDEEEEEDEEGDLEEGEFEEDDDEEDEDGGDDEGLLASGLLTAG